MRSRIVLFVVGIIFMAACSTPKAYSDTHVGKKKVKFYQQVQNGVHPKKGPDF